MSPFDDHQRRRFMRPDAHRYIRHDAHRYMKPGSPIYVGEEKVKYFWPDVEREQRSLEHDASLQRHGSDPEFDAELLRLRRDLASLRLEWELLKFASKTRKYSPSQPRVPAGNPDGGQWTSEGAQGGGGRVAGRNDPRVLSDAIPDNLVKPGARLAQNDPPRGRPVDLHEERRLGGHTIERHVGRSPESLLAQVRREVRESERTGFADGLRVGSFPSVESANKLVNSTLADNPAAIERVVGGKPRETVSKEFGSITGYEAYARNERSQPYIRDTTGVSVVIVPDRRATKGYRVDTAFPENFRR